MPKLKPEELESRRQEIIDAARTCFLRAGFHQTTTDQICREANITPGGLYHYFTSKDELISAVIERSAAAAIERMRDLIEQADDTESAFRQVAGFFYKAMQDPDVDNITRLDIEIWAEGTKNEKLAARNRTAWVLRERWLEALVQRGIDGGIINREGVEPKGMASFLISVLIGMRVARVVVGEEFDTLGAMRSLFTMQGGRMAAELTELGVPAA
ncbi:MAG: TetR/AcrR family transcriptional regulator [Dehalococcoidia bacterium]